MTDEVMMRSGIKHFYTLKPGESLAFFGDVVVVASPDAPPKIVKPDGMVEDLQPAECIGSSATVYQRLDFGPRLD
jgi:hypothetical protein